MESIKQAIESDKQVIWKNEGYQVIIDKLDRLMVKFDDGMSKHYWLLSDDHLPHCIIK